MEMLYLEYHYVFYTRTCIVIIYAAYHVHARGNFILIDANINNMWSTVFCGTPLYRCSNPVL